jgi:hypothetical protein
MLSLFLTRPCALHHEAIPSTMAAIVPPVSVSRLSIAACSAIETPNYFLVPCSHNPQVTRALRARLSYASYKATHNIPNVPLRDLESQTRSNSQSSPFSRSIAPKRKPTGTSSYYHNPGTQGPTGLGASVNPLRRSGSGAMAPPTTTASPRTYHQPVANGHLNATTITDPSSSSKPTMSSQSLYNSILAPPPTKQARTIHNASDPPVPAPSRPIASPKSRGMKTAVRSIAESTRAHTKSRYRDQAPGGSPVRRKAKRPSKGKQKQKADGMDIDADGDMDMKAAATLTSLLLHHRPSIPGSVSSPRSSIDGSEAGSAYSYSQFAQSSARTATAPVSASGSTSTATDSSFRHQTPPPSSGPTGTTTPRPAPTDNEAADLMLFLATSPSPARPSNKDSRDAAAYRALGGGSGVLRDKGRVLFPTATGDPPASGGSAPKQMLSLNRGGESSFTSSISSIGTDMGMRNSGDLFAKPMPAPSQLLPSASLPLASSLPGSPSRKDVNDSLKPVSTQGSVDFNFNDFIHASPSPSRGAIGQGQKSNLGLRADVGRKLFEEEQIRQSMNGSRSPGKRPGKRSPGAGVDLVQS